MKLLNMNCELLDFPYKGVSVNVYIYECKIYICGKAGKMNSQHDFKLIHTACPRIAAAAFFWSILFEVLSSEVEKVRFFHVSSKSLTF